MNFLYQNLDLFSEKKVSLFGKDPQFRAKETIMFVCSRLVDKATINDDQPVPPNLYAEAVQLCQKDPQNVKRLVQQCTSKLQTNFLMTRLKALNLVLHLVTNGPVGVQSELQQYSNLFSTFTTWTDAPHPTRGMQPYDEIHNTALQILSFIQGSSPSPSEPINNSYNQQNTFMDTPVQRTPQTPVYYHGNSSASLAPRNIDPNYQPTILDKIVNTISNIGHKEPNPNAVGNTGYGSVGPQYQPRPAQPPTYNNNYNQNNYGGQSNDFPQTLIIQPQYKQHGQFDRIEADISWAGKKVGNDIPKSKKVQSLDTPVAKLLNVSSGRALPTNKELQEFQQTADDGSIEELIQALSNRDWKVKARAVAGLDTLGMVVGYEEVASCKNLILEFMSYPQQSLKGVASKFYQKIKDIEPTPQQPIVEQEPQQETVTQPPPPETTEPPQPTGFNF